jgi:hypothetical protein
MSKLANARTSTAIGTGDRTEPLPLVFVALQNPMKRHELEIILMRPDAEMGDALERFILRLSIRHKKICRGLVKFHENKNGGELFELEIHVDCVAAGSPHPLRNGGDFDNLACGIEHGGIHHRIPAGMSEGEITDRTVALDRDL